MPETTPPVQLRPDGTVRVTADRVTITLRRPKLGELRRMQEALETTHDEFVGALKRIPPRMPAPARRDGEDETAYLARLTEWEAARDAQRADTRKVLAEIDDARAAWMRDTIRTLGDRELPDVPTEDLDTWVSSAEVATALVKHWQTVPLDRGAR